MSITEVANHAGVSTATVSRVLNNLPGVRAETARQVRASAEALKYVPPQLRRGGRSGGVQTSRLRRRSNSIAILTLGQSRDWLQLPVMAAAVAGISRGAKELGLKLMLDEMVDIDNPLPPAAGRQVDGAIVFVASRMDREKSVAALTLIGQLMPTVWVMGGGIGRSDIDHVSPDNYAIGNLAMEYLKKHGRRDVAFLTPLPRWPVMRARGQAFASAAHDAGARCSCYVLSDNSSDGEIFGRRCVVAADLSTLIERMAAASPRPTGLFISNDATTVQAYPLLNRHGLRPGDDVLIVSCDNEQIRLSGLSPKPASIDIGAEEAGWRAVHRLASRFKNPSEPPVMISVAPQLVEAEPAPRTRAVATTTAKV
jgi:LacI family transcriptional regulator